MSDSDKARLSNTGLWWLWLTAISVALDQLTKSLAEQYLSDGSIQVFTGFQFSLAYNRGAAFSFLSGAGGWQVWFFSILAALVSLLLLHWMRQASRDEKIQGIGLSMILGGAIGNLIDRLVAGQVVDFIDVYYGVYHWPTFNIADSSIAVGAVLFFISGWKKVD